MKVAFTELERAIRAVEAAALQMKSDQHFEEAANLTRAAIILRSIALETEPTISV